MLNRLYSRVVALAESRHAIPALVCVAFAEAAHVAFAGVIARDRVEACEQAGMPLLYIPYVPDRHEHFILRNRRILADQMEYLLASVPKTSRLHVALRVS